MQPRDVVHIGKEGWLFLWGGSNDVYKFYTQADYFSDSETESWAQLLQMRNKKISNYGARYLHVITPDKLSVYPEYVDRELPYFFYCPTRKLNFRMSDCNYYLDLLQPLSNCKNEEKLYLKTDTHWTYQGCLAAYRAICARLDIQPLEELNTVPFGEMEIAMDLGGKLEPPIEEKVRFHRPLKNAKRIHANETVIYNEQTGFKTGKILYQGNQVIFSNPSPSAAPFKVVLFGDSYSEFRPHLLTAILAEAFRELHFIWSSHIDYGYIEEVKPDIVISEIAERFVKKLPTDDIDLRKYSKERVAEVCPDIVGEMA